ncbi:MAG TPA: GNAT family N-acetyltransferase [Blastocatellia bacterium]|nr:GNAT family N-acetyltransferase [Blastocatellia bacterium]
MYPLTKLDVTTANQQAVGTVEQRPVTVEMLTADDQTEVLAFLAERPIHTFGMAGFIRSNGIVSPHNRGAFYSCRDCEGRLEGVALIGHFILFETRSDAANQAFARLAQKHSDVYMLLGEQEKVEAFWDYYASAGQAPRLFCRELLLEQRWPIEVREEVAGLRLATPDDLDLVVPAHAETALQDSGEDPLLTDPVGFRQRCAHRIENGRTWVLVEDGRLVFKAEIVADTPEVIYIEGVWVDPEERGKGYGLRCLSQLNRSFLQRADSVSLLVNEKLADAQAFYKKAGFKFVSSYDTIFLQREH